MSSTKRLGVAVLFGLGTLLALAALTSLIIAMLLKMTELDEANLAITIMILAIISMIIAGFISGLKAKARGWFAGGATGVAYSILVFLFNYLGHSQGLSNDNMLYHLGLIAASMIGGIFGVNAAKKE